MPEDGPCISSNIFHNKLLIMNMVLLNYHLFILSKLKTEMNYNLFSTRIHIPMIRLLSILIRLIHNYLVWSCDLYPLLFLCSLILSFPHSLPLMMTCKDQVENSGFKSCYEANYTVTSVIELTNFHYTCCVRDDNQIIH